MLFMLDINSIAHLPYLVNSFLKKILDINIFTRFNNFASVKLDFFRHFSHFRKNPLTIYIYIYIMGNEDTVCRAVSEYIR